MQHISGEYLPVWFDSCEEEALSESTILPNSFAYSNKSPEEWLWLNSQCHQCGVRWHKSLPHPHKSRFITLPIKQLIQLSYVTVMFHVLALNFLEEAGSLISNYYAIAIGCHQFILYTCSMLSTSLEYVNIMKVGM